MIHERLFRGMAERIISQIGSEPTQRELTWPHNHIIVNRRFLRELIRREQELAQLRALITTPEVIEFIRSSDPKITQA